MPEDIYSIGPAAPMQDALRRIHFAMVIAMTYSLCRGIGRSLERLGD